MTHQERITQTLAVIYAAKSTKDRRLSIPEQLEDCREMCAENSWTVVGEFVDENFTAYTGNRGPGLAKAIETAKAAASKDNWVMLVAQHTSRFARGDGAAPDAPNALVELWHQWARANVRGRTVENDRAMSTSADAAKQGEADHEDSKRKSISVRKGLKRRARDRGKLAGGQRPYGFNSISLTEQIPAEAKVVRRIYSDAIEGRSQLATALALNKEGVPASKGGAWSQGSIYCLLNNPLYYGAIRHRGEVLPGAHEPIVSEETWKAAAAVRTSKSRNRQRGGGAYPTGDHLLTKGLLRCSCGATLAPRTDPRAKSRPHQVYQCLGRYADVSSCDQAPIERSIIDDAILREVSHRWLNFEETRERFIARRTTDVQIAQDALAEAERKAEDARQAMARIEGDYVDGRIDADKWNRLEATLLDRQAVANAELAQTQKRVQDLERAHQTDAEIEVLRQLAELRAAALGTIEEAPDLNCQRVLLRQLFRSITHLDGQLLLSVNNPDEPDLIEEHLVDDSAEYTPRRRVALPMSNGVSLVSQLDVEPSPLDALFAPITL